MRIFGIWTIFVALVISAIAAYYSIIGLIAIFAAAVIPVIVMGTALEIGKITSAIWLHANWTNGKILIKTYLVFAVLLLMFITSMGIFGFLSKAHIEQNAQGLEGVAQLARIETEIVREEEEIVRAELKIAKLDTADTNADDELQNKIDVEEVRIETVYARVSNDINFTQTTLESTVTPYNTQVQQAETVLTQMAQYVADNNINALQALVGATQDGNYGKSTAKKVAQFRYRTEQSRDDALAQIKIVRNASQIEIVRLRETSDKSIAQSNKLIDRLRAKLGTSTNTDVEEDINVQRVKIQGFELSLDTLFEEKYSIESEARILEAEVGPVKYIAELVYGDTADRDALEDAVRWIIFILVIVFDPLAIVLVIAGITLTEQHPRKKKVQFNVDEIVSLNSNEPNEENVVIFEPEKHNDNNTSTDTGQDTSNADAEAIEYQGVVYQPNHYAYNRVKEQIELNNLQRKYVNRERDTLVNSIVDELHTAETGVSVDIVKKKLEEMFVSDKKTIEIMRNADAITKQTVFNTIIKDSKK